MGANKQNLLNEENERARIRKDAIKEMADYMGAKEYHEYRTMSAEDRDFLVKRKLDLKKSYFVKGNREKLRKFEVLYLAALSNDKPLKRKFNLREYVVGTSDLQRAEHIIDEYDVQTVFVYINKQLSGVGKIENWLFTSLLANIADRNRWDQSSVVLSERSIPELEKSDELVVIDLGGAEGAIDIKETADRAKDKPQEQPKSNNPVDVCY